MANWRHIQGRIRKAKAGADAATALEQLYARTQDAMVAFELAALCEKNAAPGDAARWYRASHARFRRDQWKQRIVDALARLGEPLDGPVAEASAEAVAAAAAERPTRSNPVPVFEETAIPLGDAEPDSLAAGPAVSDFALAGDAVPAAESDAGAAASEGRRKRRRGRRGGRGRRRGKGGAADTAAPRPASPVPLRAAAAVVTTTFSDEPERAPRGHASSRRSQSSPVPLEPGESVLAGRLRSGDPGLASRVSALEMNLRRLLACPAHPFESAADDAPAGPGVYLLSESDGSGHYFAEACKTLRIAVGQLARGRTNTGTIKSSLADHLGISETKVGAYLKQHCVVRWLQLDEEAARMAHFAVAVLRPALNE
jgi:hypothetical protein